MTNAITASALRRSPRLCIGRCCRLRRLLVLVMLRNALEVLMLSLPNVRGKT